MPVDSAGNATRPPSPIPVSGQDADAPQVNVPVDDIYATLNLLAFLDGRKSLRGNIPMNGYRAVGAADAAEPQDYVTLSQLQSLLASLSQVPTGIMAPLSGTVIPAGWVQANGQTLTRSSYPTLWAFAQSSENLATTEEDKTAGQYGPGNGATTFTVPNLEANGGYFIRPISTGRGIGTIQQDEFKSHDHGGQTSANGEHAHDVTVNAYGVAGMSKGWTGRGGANDGPFSFPTTSDGLHAHTIPPSGGTETRPKNIAFPVIIKA